MPETNLPAAFVCWTSLHLRADVIVNNTRNVHRLGLDKRQSCGVATVHQFDESLACTVQSVISNNGTCHGRNGVLVRESRPASYSSVCGSQLASTANVLSCCPACPGVTEWPAVQRRKRRDALHSRPDGTLRGGLQAVARQVCSDSRVTFDLSATLHWWPSSMWRQGDAGFATLFIPYKDCAALRNHFLAQTSSILPLFLLLFFLSVSADS